MAKMIEVTAAHDGRRWLINTRWIEQIQENESGTTIYFAFNIPNAYDQDNMDTRESYEEVKMKVWGCNGE